MTITLIGEIDGQRSATNAKGVRTYQTAYLLETDTKTDTAWDIGSATGLPVIGDTFSDDGSAYCNNIEIKNSSPWKGWTASYTYSTDQQLSSIDPEDDEVKVSMDTEIYQEPVFADVDGNAVVNSAGDFYLDPGPVRDNTHLIWKIKSNHKIIPAWVLTKQNNVNSLTITIGGLAIAAGRARMCRLQVGERQRRNDIDYYSLSFEVHVHETGWLLEPMDVGFRELEYGELVQITNAGDGEEVTAPVMLDGAGKAQDNPSPSSAVFGSHKVYVTSDLSVLPGID